LRAIASGGPRVMYEGAIGQAIADDLAANGAPFTRDDFANYQATIVPALTTTYGDAEVHTIGGGTGGTTLVESLNIASQFGLRDLGYHTPAALNRMAQAFRIAFADRFAWLGDATQVDVPVEALTDLAYARERATEQAVDRFVELPAATAGRVGISHGLGTSVPDYVGSALTPGQMTDGSTTHLSVMDGDGMAVSCTQTLLSLWGSRVTVPGTGVLMNNGMMWFDPAPNRPNSVAGGKTPLCNMAPLTLSRGGKPFAAIGSSGGRRILNCNAQLIMNMTDWRLAAQAAINAPRIDCSTGELLMSSRFPEATVEAMRALGHRVGVRDERRFTGDFASPAVVRLGADRIFDGGADPFYAPGTAMSVRGVND
ncbi:MAG: gamma-glutamyltransferase, partial [Chloroflexia bacterium]|nr:gamma-glutamyltransferase [Chloroflexia bacterium]